MRRRGLKDRHGAQAIREGGPQLRGPSTCPTFAQGEGQPDLAGIWAVAPRNHSISAPLALKLPHPSLTLSPPPHLPS